MLENTIKKKFLILIYDLVLYPRKVGQRVRIEKKTKTETQKQNQNTPNKNNQQKYQKIPADNSNN